MDYKQRNADIARGFMEGRSFDELGAEHDLNPESVRNLLARLGYRRPPPPCDADTDLSMLMLNRYRWSYADIADEYGVSIGRVRHRIHRARARGE